MARFEIMVKEGKEEQFESYCLYWKIGFTLAQGDSDRTYNVSCDPLKILDVGHCIEHLKDLPKRPLC